MPKLAPGLPGTAGLATLVLATAGFALTPRWEISQFAHATWQTRDGLPQGSVNAVAQTPDGYLWLGTDAGLVRFDGVTFTTFDRRNVEVFENLNVRSLAADTAGRLWIGTGGGLLERDADGRFTLFTLADGLPAGSVTSLVPSADGESLWIGTYGGGVARLRDGRFEVWSVAEGLLDDVVLDLLEDRHGDVWAACHPGGVNHLRGGRVVAGYTHRDGLTSDLVVSLAEGPEGTLWIGTLSGLNRRRNGTIEPVAREGELAEAAVADLVVDRDGSLWIGTYSRGLMRWAGGRLDSFSERHGLTAEAVRVLFEDGRGSLWIGTAAGLDRLREGVFRTLGRPEGLAENQVLDVYRDSSGRTWIGTWGGGLQLLEPNGRLVGVTTADGLPHDFVGAFAEDRDGYVWLGTPRGAHRWTEDALEHGFLTLDRRRGLAADAVYELRAARAGGLWIGTNAGLARYRNERIDLWTRADGLLDDQVRALVEDAAGRLYVGTMGGVSVLEGGVIRPEAGAFEGRHVRSLHLDTDGDLWAATNGGGLYLMHEGEETSFTQRDGLPNDSLCLVTEDPDGRLWVSSSLGIFQLDKDQLRRLAAARRRGPGAPAVSEMVRAVLYDTTDGLPSDTCIRNHGGLIGDELWFPTAAGVAILDVERLGTERAEPRVVIEEARLDGRTVTLGPAAGSGTFVEVPAGVRSLEVSYTVLGLAAPHRARFRVRLAGFDDWSEVGPRRVAYYTHLPPRTFRFEVAVDPGDGAWAPRVAAFTLRVRPAFYETWGFYLGVAAAVLLSAWGGHRLRIRRLERTARRLDRMRRQVEAKNVELEEKNAELERFTYTVSHDLKSPLVTIRGFLGYLRRDLASGSRDQVESALEHIDGAARRMARQLDDLLELSRIGRVVNAPQTVDLGGLVEEARAALRGSIVEGRAEITVEPDLPAVWGDRERLAEVFQNLLENALRYSRPGTAPRIEVSARPEGGKVLCTVRDDGRGIDPRYHDRVFRLFEQLEPTGQGTGIGLALVRRIVEHHGGRIWIESEGEDRGTAVLFTLPAASQAAL